MPVNEPIQSSLQPRTGGGSAAPPRFARGPIRRLLDLFSSIWLGVILLSLLFIYSTIGSAGILLPGVGHVQVRQLRIFEMTEYEWFHYWPFNLLIALICISLVVATLRRIPLKPINFGVWMIHSGIIILALGSVWYFGTKVEGDAIIGRRMVRLELPGVEPVSVAAQPGKRAEIASDDVTYSAQVTSIDPHWELLSGPDKGKRAYSVTLSIQRRDASGEQFFMRQLIAGFPQYTEDIVRTNNHTQPMQRAKKINPDGDPLVDKTLTASLQYQPQQHFFLVNSAALYLREVDAHGRPMSQWIQRSIEKLPRYNEYISDYDSVWLAPTDTPPPLSDLRIGVPAADGTSDPLAGEALVVTDYLRYAVMDERRVPGGNVIDPVVTLQLTSPDGRSATYELVARDPARRAAENGRLEFNWVQSDQELRALTQAPGPRLSIAVPEHEFGETVDVDTTVRRNPDAPFINLGDTGYSYRVERLENGLVISDELTISVAMVQVRAPNGREYLRMVREDPTANADFPLSDVVTGHEQPLQMDESITMQYLPGERPAAVTVIAGPQPDQLHVINTITGDGALQPIDIGGSIDLGGATLTVRRYASRTVVEQRPAVIAAARRNPELGSQLSMIRVSVPAEDGNQSVWLPYHLFPFEHESSTIRRFRYEPVRVVVDDRGTNDAADDRVIELMYSRRRLPLPAPVVLDDFVLTTHTGGFTGDGSIRNWTSVVRFADQSHRHLAWHEPREVSVNDPIEHEGFWFFQSQWDAPDPPRGAGDAGSMGLNFTVLGVGNRNGVNVMLAGCGIAVIGMLYAFYMKPIIRRRKILKMHAGMSQGGDIVSRNGQPEAASQPQRRPLETVGASESELQQ